MCSRRSVLGASVACALALAVLVPHTALAESEASNAPYASKGQLEVGGNVLAMHDGPMYEDMGVDVVEFGQVLSLAPFAGYFLTDRIQLVGAARLDVSVPEIHRDDDVMKGASFFGYGLEVSPHYYFRILSLQSYARAYAGFTSSSVKAPQQTGSYRETNQHLSFGLGLGVVLAAGNGSGGAMRLGIDLGLGPGWRTIESGGTTMKKSYLWHEDGIRAGFSLWF